MEIEGMSMKENGGPAFPVLDHITPERLAFASHGMTLRDYFAAKAMQGFMANKNIPTRFSPEDDASYFYAIADAMLAERAK